MCIVDLHPKERRFGFSTLQLMKKKRKKFGDLYIRNETVSDQAQVQNVLTRFYTNLRARAQSEKCIYSQIKFLLMCIYLCVHMLIACIVCINLYFNIMFNLNIYIIT